VWHAVNTSYPTPGRVTGKTDDRVRYPRQDVG
jgi:hypothetical protein